MRLVDLWKDAVLDAGMGRKGVLRDDERGGMMGASDGVAVVGEDVPAFTRLSWPPAAVWSVTAGVPRSIGRELACLGIGRVVGGADKGVMVSL